MSTIRSRSFMRKRLVRFPVRHPKAKWISWTSDWVVRNAIDTSRTLACVQSLLLLHAGMQYHRSNTNAKKYKITFRPVWLPIFGSRFRIVKFILLSFGIAILGNVQDVFLDVTFIEKPTVHFCDRFPIASIDNKFDQLRFVRFRQLRQSELWQTNNNNENWRILNK